MTQLIVLGGITALFAAVYMYFEKNRANYVRDEKPPENPPNVIYLPHVSGSGENSDENTENPDDRPTGT